jgi:tetratricopeptide (TPR) repeat protein
MAREPSNGRAKHRDDVADCRNLLRDFRDPQRLRRNPLASAVFEFVPEALERRLLLEGLITNALGRLDARSRAIIERCDLGRELFADVATDLGLSERHLYRERRRILVQLAAVIRDSSKRPISDQFDATLSLDGQLRISRVLEDNGDRATARSIVEGLITCSTDSDQRLRLFLELAQLYARGRDFELSEKYVKHAEASCQESALSKFLFAEILVTRAMILEESGRGTAVAKFAALAANAVRETGAYRYDPIATKTLLEALFLCARSYASSGNTADLAHVCREAADIINFLQRSDPELQVELLFANGLRDRFVNYDLRSARSYFYQAANVARDAGLTLCSISCLTNVAQTYWAANEPLKAIAALEQILPIVRSIGDADSIVRVIVDLASARIDLRQYEQARGLLDEANALQAPHQSLQGSTLRVNAMLALAYKNFKRCLEMARGADELFSKLGKRRLVGAPKLLQAQAFMAMGERRAALRSISNAIAVLESTGARSDLAQAYGILGELTSDEKYASVANGLYDTERDGRRLDR